jgi:hypothetical protein
LAVQRIRWELSGTGWGKIRNSPVAISGFLARPLLKYGVLVKAGRLDWRVTVGWTAYFQFNQGSKVFLPTHV